MSSGSRAPAEARAVAAGLLDPSEASRLDAPGSMIAAVLVPLLELEGRMHVVLTRRPADMRRHGGEIAFPGGRRDPEDDTTTTTALREAEEEIGLDRDDVEVLGALEPVGTMVTGYAVYPIVGWILREATWRLSPREVDEVLVLDLEHLAAGRGTRRMVRRGIPFRTAVYELDGHVVWGATARMVDHLLARLPEGVPAVQPVA